jgi:hypothetical protein
VRGWSRASWNKGAAEGVDRGADDLPVIILETTRILAAAQVF